MKLTIRCGSLLLFIFLFFIQSNAQTAYSMHTLAQGETLSVLAKTYHTTVGDIMRMNGMNAQSQLRIGDKLKIPAGGTTVAREPVAATSASVISATSFPKTHVVAVGETLYHISQVYKVPVDKLITLNNLPDGNVKVGQTLMLSGDATLPVTPSLQPSKERTAQAAGTTPALPQPAVKESKQPATPKENTPVKDIIADNQLKKESASQPVTSTPVTAASADDNNSNQPSAYPVATDAPKEGFFTSLYGKDGQQRNEQSKTGSAMTFKSASGWADKKYYILMNDAPTGSVVKIKSGKNELYAKVLWGLGEMKENDGLRFRISTATAAALGITDQKFDLKVSYYE